MAEAYLRATDAALPDGVLDELLDAFGRLPAGPPQPGGAAQSGGTDPEATAGQAILGDAKLGPVARTVTPPHGSTSIMRSVLSGPSISRRASRTPARTNSATPAPGATRPPQW